MEILFLQRFAQPFQPKKTGIVEITSKFLETFPQDEDHHKIIQRSLEILGNICKFSTDFLDMVRKKDPKIMSTLLQKVMPGFEQIIANFETKRCPDSVRYGAVDSALILLSYLCSPIGKTYEFEAIKPGIEYLCEIPFKKGFFLFFRFRLIFFFTILLQHQSLRHKVRSSGFPV